MNNRMWFDERRAADAPAWFDEDERIAWAQGWNAAVQCCTNEQNAIFNAEMGRMHQNHRDAICWCGAGPKANNWEDDAMDHRTPEEMRDDEDHRTWGL